MQSNDSDVIQGHIEEVGEIEAELLEAHRKVMTGSMRIKLMKSLLGRGLCLRDVFSFASNQAENYEMNTELDREIINSAMKAKIRDSKLVVISHQRSKRKKEKELLGVLGGYTKTWRTILKQIRKKVNEEKELLQKKYDKKIKHYSTVQNRQNKQTGEKKKRNLVAPTIPPRYLGEYSSLSVFGTPEDLNKKEEPLGPFLTSKDIELSYWERKLLSKDPKFSLKFNPKKMELSTEIERMNSKVRYDLGYDKKKKNCKLNRITTPDGKPIDWAGGKVNVIDKDGIGDELLGIFMEAKDSHIYNPLEGSISFLNRKPTDYKLNKTVILPKALDSEKEFQCELRRLEYMKALEEYNKDLIQHIGSSSKRKKKERKGNDCITVKTKGSNCIDSDSECTKYVPNTTFLNFSSKAVETTEGTGADKSHDDKYTEREKDGEKKASETVMRRTNIKEKKNKKKRDTERPTNLLKQEAEAMKSLKKKINSGSLVVSQTDKSSRFAVLTRQQYLESGRVHTGKDRKIMWKDVGRLQTQVNNHVWWVSKALRYSENKDSKRMLRNVMNHSLEVPDMALLIKDHKVWQESSNTPVPSRPVVSGNKGVNTHLSEIIAELLEPLVLELGGGEVTSTEEALFLVENLNKKIKNGDNLTDINVLESFLTKRAKSDQPCVKENIGTTTALNETSGATYTCLEGVLDGADVSSTTDTNWVDSTADSIARIRLDSLDIDYWGLNESDVDTVILLEQLARERNKPVIEAEGNEDDTETPPLQVCTNGEGEKTLDKKSTKVHIKHMREQKRDIRSYFKCVE